jgi:hypothetical protein
MNKPYNIQNTNICNGIFHISFFKALLINEGETTHRANRIRGESTRIRLYSIMSLALTEEEDVFLDGGLTKQGEVGDFFALVSMKSPNFCQKAKF